jgi:hypothetical protein
VSKITPRLLPPYLNFRMPEGGLPVVIDYDNIYAKHITIIIYDGRNIADYVSICNIVSCLVGEMESSSKMGYDEDGRK